MIILVCEVCNEPFGYIKVYHKLLILFYSAGSQPRSVSPHSMVRMCLHLACFMKCQYCGLADCLHPLVIKMLQQLLIIMKILLVVKCPHP
jgi:hypothetical protein